MGRVGAVPEEDLGKLDEGEPLAVAGLAAVDDDEQERAACRVEGHGGARVGAAWLV